MAMLGQSPRFSWFGSQDPASVGCISDKLKQFWRDLIREQ